MRLCHTGSASDNFDRNNISDQAIFFDDATLAYHSFMNANANLIITINKAFDKSNTTMGVAKIRVHEIFDRGGVHREITLIQVLGQFDH